jgi:lysophospholipase
VTEARLRGSRETPRRFDPAAVREGLRELELGGLAVASTDEQDYLAFYRIDFANRIPGVVHRFGRLPAAGFEIACHYYQPAAVRGTCVLLHGYYDHAGLYGHLIEHCLRRRFAVLIWDLPGHGLSSGPQASIHSFEDYIEVLGAVLGRLLPELPRPLHAIGQSTGAAVLMGWAFRKCRSPEECPFGRMVLLAPLVRPAQWRSVRLMHALVRPFRRAIKRTFMENSGDAEFLAFVQQDPLQCRVLPVRWVTAMRRWVDTFLAQPETGYRPRVVQGNADQTVDWQWNLPRIREKFPGAEVHMIVGARHQLVNETRELREQVFAAMGLDGA